MPREHSAVLAFNRGVLSKLALARMDISRYKMAAQKMTNWIARVLGSMMLRPGTGYIGVGTLGFFQARVIPFIFGATDTARIEVTGGAMRVLVNDALVTRPHVTALVTNGTFQANLNGWTNNSEAGATVTWTGASLVAFLGTGTNNAILDQEVAVNEIGTRHALRILILRGPFTLRVGTVQGDDTYINETTLYAGTHSLAFTPTTANFWIRFEAATQYSAMLESCVLEGPGVMVLPGPVLQADVPNIRWSQSADVVFVGCAGGPNSNGYPQMQIERRATDSWSLAEYPAYKGPFRVINITNLTLTPSAVTGDITLTASRNFFKQGHVGALFRLISTGQVVTAALAAGNTFTNPVLINGTGAQRNLQLTVGGSFSGTLTLQYSVGTPGTWIDQQTVAGSGTFNDGLDNQAIYYRLGFKTGNYVSGTANVAESTPQGSITGIARVTGYQSPTLVNASVLTPLGGTSATTNWYEGAWSSFRGFPGTPSLWQGRLWWFGVSVFGSVSDDYPNFDDTTLGESAPIVGQLDQGPVENIYWAIGLQQIVVGTASGETSIRSTYLMDPVTPTNFNVLTGSTQGSANVNALQVDRSGIFVQISGQRVFSLDLDIYTYSYRSTELTLFAPDYNAAGIVQIGVQQKPDRRLHCVRADGTVGILVYDQVENVTCWQEYVSPNGFVEDVSVLPGSGIAEDQVYYIVRRVVNGATVRYHEKWALESQCTGFTDARVSDSFVTYAGAAVSNLPQIAPHLAGQQVCVWGWNTQDPYVDGFGDEVGLDLGTYYVQADGSVGQLMFEGTPYNVTNATVGLPYVAQWQSMKQAFAAALGTPFNQLSRINRLGLMLQNTHGQGLQYGVDFDHLDDIPQADLPTNSPNGDDVPMGADDESAGSYSADATSPTADADNPDASAAGAYADVNAIFADYDTVMGGADDVWSTDKRVCLQAASPRPACVVAFTVDMSNSG